MLGKPRLVILYMFEYFAWFLWIVSKFGKLLELNFFYVKDRKGETNESARKQLEDVKQRAAEKTEEDRGKLDEPDEGDKYVNLFNFFRLNTV